MKNFDKFGGFKNNQIKTIIFMLRTVTEDLDYALEVLLLEVIFLVIKDFFSISSEETWWMEELLTTEEPVELKFFYFLKVFLFWNFCVALQWKQPVLFIVFSWKTHYLFPLYAFIIAWAFLLWNILIEILV